MPPSSWVTAYYAGFYWDWTGDDPAVAVAAVDMSTMTHLVFARYAAGGGTLGGDPGDLLPGAGTAHDALEPLLIAKAHEAGISVLMTVGGEDEGGGWNASTIDAPTRAIFIANLLAKASSLGYDGIDLDWEDGLDSDASQAQAIALLTELRAAAAAHPFYQLPHAPILLTWPALWGNINYFTATPWHIQVASLVDQYNIMTYAMAGNYEGWQSWHFSPLAGAAEPHPTSIESTVNEYLQAGIPASKLGIGFGLYAITYGPPVTGPRQTSVAGFSQNDATNNHRQLVHEKAFHVTGSTHHWDTHASQDYWVFDPPWTRSDGEVVSYMSYESERSIGVKGAWAKSKGLGGAIVWTINYGYLGKSGNPLMKAVKRAFLD